MTNTIDTIDRAQLVTVTGGEALKPPCEASPSYDAWMRAHPRYAAWLRAKMAR